MHDPEPILRRWEAIRGVLDERQRRAWLAAEAQTLGWGGQSAVIRATGCSVNTIKRGLEDLTAPALTGTTVHGKRRTRRPGAGRPRAVDAQPGLAVALDSLVDPVTRGDPMSLLRWTSKSAERLSVALNELGFRTSARSVLRMLHEQGYSLQSNRKRLEGTAHPDRDAQFQFIAKRSRAQALADQPIISVDTKKKEIVGNFRNAGREWHRSGQPEEVEVHDFLDPDLGKAIPYGVYDLTENAGWVNVGIDHDTAEFAVNSIREWWKRMGAKRYPSARSILITADCGGSNGNRTRAWKFELQRFANETGLEIKVCHFPPGTSKWNKIEHRLFCHITHNWRGKPLRDLATIVNLIGNTKTTTGLVVRARLDLRKYPKGITVSDREMQDLNIKPSRFHGEWNYSIAPQATSVR